jgi:hypothetical protein
VPARRRHPITPLVRHSVGLAFAAPEVVAHRLLRLWAAGASPSLRDLQELQVMWLEKCAAFYESWTAICLAMWRANPGVVAAGLRPIHRRAGANARRLRRRR